MYYISPFIQISLCFMSLIMVYSFLYICHTHTHTHMYILPLDFIHIHILICFVVVFVFMGIILPRCNNLLFFILFTIFNEWLLHVGVILFVFLVTTKAIRISNILNIYHIQIALDELAFEFTWYYEQSTIIFFFILYIRKPHRDFH